VLGGMLIAIVGCAPAQQGSGPGATEDASPARQNMLRVAGSVDVTVLHDRLKPGNDDPLDPFVNAGLAQHDDKDVARPMLLERLPSQDEGTWMVNPDGTMKTLLTLRSALKWQDGNPLTSADVVFAFQVYRDQDLPRSSDVPVRD